MRFELLKPNKKLFFKQLHMRRIVNYLDEIQWLVNSDLDVSFYREDEDMTVEITKEEMRVALEHNWEMRG